jgi:hypothetical protein
MKLTLSFLLATLLAQASTNYVTNPTFGTTSNYSIYGNSTLSGWTEDNSNTGQQIDCVVALANTTNICGNPGPGNSAHVNIANAPGGTLPNGITNYFLEDGDTQYGAPISTTLTGLTTGVAYVLSFYQSSNEQSGYSTPDNDNWQVFLINGSTGSSSPTNPAYASPIMANSGGVATPWELETYTFFATATTETLEFLANASVSNVPPFLGLTDVSVVAAPEPDTWAMLLCGLGALSIGVVLRGRLTSGRQ